MLQLLFSVTLLLTSCVSTSPPLDAADQYLLEEFSRVIGSKYESELDKPLNTELQSKLDALFDSSIPFFSDSPRTRRSSNEVKEGKFVCPINRSFIVSSSSLEAEQTGHNIDTVVLL